MPGVPYTKDDFKNFEGKYKNCHVYMKYYFTILEQSDHPITVYDKIPPIPMFGQIHCQLTEWTSISSPYDEQSTIYKQVKTQNSLYTQQLKAISEHTGNGETQIVSRNSWRKNLSIYNKLSDYADMNSELSDFVGNLLHGNLGKVIRHAQEKT